ncbi:diaminobutyrate--2-oxoglutarate transaminase [Natrinema versiforme]|uniref:Aminotransferase class III-fold pyridoxal phosphate-dependent enzyme n=1 Tax=Natrinema versiforme TaxID=88724 RepID=A0A4P8WLU9_9EURY|nr:diaminobutyrate--2-oxoglutarate transaminase [Natrinema versiforme]QCS44122.1 aminotransferase class III-fold pyridoxal phosphate-dependent enzyme [Natrinema versiforme]
MTDDGSSAEGLLAQQARRESNARTYPRSLPLAIDRAEGAILEDVDGNEYVDCLAGAGTLALGHNHPAVVERMEDLLERDRAVHTLDLTTPVKERFVDRLLESLPDEFAETARVQFCSPAGTDAVEAALKLVKTATGNRSMLAFQGGYHGMTNGALSLMGDTAAKEPVPGLMPDVHHLPYPYEYRCPFGLGGEDCWRTSAEYVDRTLSNPDGGIVDPAGMILEPVQGEGGAIPAPAEWLREMRRVTRERDVPLIVDEIQTGLGRTGELYGFEHADIVPDVVTLSKAIGGGLPLSVVVYDESLDIWEPGAHAGTFRGNQLGMAAGTATIEHVLEHDLADHAAAMGDRLRAHLEETAATFEAVGDVRGRGLLLGMEIVDPAGDPDSLGHFPADGDLASAVQSEAFDRGLVIETGGRRGSVVRFLPPLTISGSRIDEVGEIVHESVRAAVEGGQRRAEAPA